ncbi:MAG: VanW family protein [Anaerolineae bacterium]|nr:VanW family protein [Anaerolineae bacterium]
MSRLLVVLTAIEVIAVVAIGWMLGPGLDQRLLPGVWVWDASLGGMTVEEAAARLETTLPLHQPSIVLLGPEEQRWALSPADLGMSVNAEATLAQAYRVGHEQVGREVFAERIDVILNGTHLSPVLTWDADLARGVLNAVANELTLPAQDAAVRLQGAQVILEPGKVGRRMEVSATLQALLPALHALEPLEMVAPVTELPPAIDDAQAQVAIHIAEEMLAEPLTLLLSDPGEGDPGPWEIPPDVLAKMMTIHVQADQVSVALDQAALAQQLGTLATALYRAPVDATFEFNTDTLEMTVTSSSRTGREMDVAASVQKVNEMLRAGEHWVPLVIKTIEPEVPDTLTAEDLGIRELVAVGESYFTGSSSARDSNIRLGASKFDGVLIAPGEVFSFNEHLGDVTPEAGYDESYVIIGNRTVPGVGGGICQVATTAFRAAYFGGYPIIERWPHAYRVGYYEIGGFGPGFDATIYSPVVDFRFQNDTPHHLLITTEVDAANSRLRFLFYSTDIGREVEQIGPEWGDPVSPGPPVYEYDASLPAGTVRKLESAHDGLSAVLGRVVRDADGNVLYEDEFVSDFIPWPTRYAFGPGYVPPANAEVVGTPEP